MQFHLKVCKLIPFENRKKIATVVSEYDGPDTETLLKITLDFFQETFDFDLIINALENIYKYDIHCNNSESIKIVNLAIKTAIQWNDFTVLNLIVKLFIKMWETDKTTINIIIDFYKTINGISIQTIERIFIENEGMDLMNIINNSITKSKVFISFCDADEDIAELVYDALYGNLSPNYEILKYDHKVRYMDSLTDFMNQIKECKKVVMIVSDAYLKSEGCMYEALVTMNGHNCIEKMLPIFIKKDDSKFYGDKKNPVPANIFGQVDNLTYSTYWANITKEQHELGCVSKL